MTCGEVSEHKNRRGGPCGFTLPTGATACAYHSTDAAGRSLLASKGPEARRMKRLLPAEYRVPAFDTREAVQRFARDLAHKVLTEKVDPRRVDTALRAAGVALSALTAQTQEKLLETLLRLEHGEMAMGLLLRLQEGVSKGRREKIPEKVRVLPPLETS